MYKIVICIPTYKRPFGLKKLLLSIIDCNIDKTMIRDVHVIIVDNDINKSAERTYSEIKQASNSLFGIEYHSYAVKGLANIRNEIFRIALLWNPDYIVSIDDDEFVTKEWLNQLISTLIETNGNLVAGPVFPYFNKRVPDYISCWFSRQTHSDKQRIYIFRTGNYVIDVNFLVKYNLKFDERFNTRGGEDSYFGLTARKKGAKIYWAEKAIVFETIPEDRTKITWLMKRSFHGAANFVYQLKLDNQYLNLSRKFFISLSYLLSGVAALVLIFIPMKKRLWGILKISEGIGGLAGIFNIRYNAYK